MHLHSSVRSFASKEVTFTLHYITLRCCPMLPDVVAGCCNPDMLNMVLLSTLFFLNLVEQIFCKFQLTNLFCCHFQVYYWGGGKLTPQKLEMFAKGHSALQV